MNTDHQTQKEDEKIFPYERMTPGQWVFSGAKFLLSIAGIAWVINQFQDDE